MEETKVIGQEYTLTNGEVVRLSLSFGKLNLLKKLENELYERFNKILYGKSEDILDLVTIVYVGYWCANFKVTEKLYTEEEFIELVEFDTIELQKTFKGLTQPKKK